jgi:hypothetical protein
LTNPPASPARSTPISGPPQRSANWDQEGREPIAPRLAVHHPTLAEIGDEAFVQIVWCVIYLLLKEAVSMFDVHVTALRKM